MNLPPLRNPAGALLALTLAGFLPASLRTASAAAPTMVPATATAKVLAAPATPKPATNGSRFLFVVDMSSSMKATDPANRQALFDLIFTGFEGQMRHGDSFGLWLFNDEVRAGEFPLQVWDEQNPLEVASRATQFVRSQKYSGKPRLDEVVSKMLQVARSVKDVHLVLISTGEQPLQGTPLDGSINEAWARRQPERRKAGKPLVTTLNARQGDLVSAVVTLAGEFIQLPERPAPPAPTVVATPPPARPAPSPAPKPAEPPRTTAKFSTPAPPTTPPVRVWTPEPAVALQRPAPPPAPSAAAAVTTQPAPALTPAPANPPSPAPSIAPAPVPTPTTAPAAVVQAAPPVTPAPAPVPAAAPDPTPTEPVPVAAPPTRPLATLLPEPVRVQARELTPPEPDSTASPAPAVPATVVVVQPGLGPTVLLATGAALLGACVILLALVLRRPQARAAGSVITQSMDRR